MKVMKLLITLLISFNVVFNAEQDKYLAKEEIDNYTVYLIQKELIASKEKFKSQCPGGFQKLKILYIPKDVDQDEVDFSHIIGVPKRLYKDKAYNLHYVIINCLDSAGNNLSQLVLYGKNFGSAKQRLPLGCSTPIIPTIENPEVDKCKKGNDLIEYMVKTVIKNEEIKLFDRSELDPFISQLTQISNGSANQTTDLKAFQQNLRDNFKDLKNVKLQFIKEKIDCIKTKLIDRLNINMSVVAACALNSDLDEIVSSLITKALLEKISDASDQQIKDMVKAIMKNLQLDMANIVTIDSKLTMEDNQITNAQTDSEVDRQFDLPEGDSKMYIQVVSTNGSTYYLDFDEKSGQMRRVDFCEDAKNGRFTFSVAKDRSFNVKTSNNMYFSFNSDKRVKRQRLKLQEEAAVNTDGNIKMNSTFVGYKFNQMYWFSPVQQQNFAVQHHKNEKTMNIERIKTLFYINDAQMFSLQSDCMSIEPPILYNEDLQENFQEIADEASEESSQQQYQILQFFIFLILFEFCLQIPVCFVQIRYCFILDKDHPYQITYTQQTSLFVQQSKGIAVSKKAVLLGLIFAKKCNIHPALKGNIINYYLILIFGFIQCF